MTTAYPPAFRADLQEILNGYLVADPYRWLEDPGSKETRSWLAAQDALYAEHLAALPGRESLATRLAELLGAGTVSTPSGVAGGGSCCGGCRARSTRCCTRRRPPAASGR